MSERTSTSARIVYISPALQARPRERERANSLCDCGMTILRHLRVCTYTRAAKTMRRCVPSAGAQRKKSGGRPERRETLLFFIGNKSVIAGKLNDALAREKNCSRPFCDDFMRLLLLLLHAAVVARPSTCVFSCPPLAVLAWLGKG